MKVRELIEQLKRFPVEANAVCWLPGTRIDLAGVFPHNGEVCIEGNVREGSALERLKP